MGHSSVQFFFFFPPPISMIQNTILSLKWNPFINYLYMHQYSSWICVCVSVLLQVRTKLEASLDSAWRSSGDGDNVSTGTSHVLSVNKHWSDNSISVLLLVVLLVCCCFTLKKECTPLRPRLSIWINYTPASLLYRPSGKASWLIDWFSMLALLLSLVSNWGQNDMTINYRLWLGLHSWFICKSVKKNPTLFLSLNETLLVC